MLTGNNPVEGLTALRTAQRLLAEEAERFRRHAAVRADRGDWSASGSQLPLAQLRDSRQERLREVRQAPSMDHLGRRPPPAESRGENLVNPAPIGLAVVLDVDDVDPIENIAQVL